MGIMKLLMSIITDLNNKIVPMIASLNKHRTFIMLIDGMYKISLMNDIRSRRTSNPNVNTGVIISISKYPKILQPLKNRLNG